MMEGSNMEESNTVEVENHVEGINPQAITYVFEAQQ